MDSPLIPEGRRKRGKSLKKRKKVTLQQRSEKRNLLKITADEEDDEGTEEAILESIVEAVEDEEEMGIAKYSPSYLI